MPEELPAAATPGLLLSHSPPETPSVYIVDVVAQISDAPEIGVGGGLTPTATVVIHPVVAV